MYGSVKFTPDGKCDFCCSRGGAVLLAYPEIDKVFICPVCLTVLYEMVTQGIAALNAGADE